jgi:hypothetical protein
MCSIRFSSSSAAICEVVCLNAYHENSSKCLFSWFECCVIVYFAHMWAEVWDENHDHTNVHLFKSEVKCSKLKIKFLKCAYYVLHVQKKIFKCMSRWLKIGIFLLQNYGGDLKSKIIHFAAVTVHVPEATYQVLACFWALKQHLYWRHCNTRICSPWSVLLGMGVELRLLLHGYGCHCMLQQMS